MGGWNFDENNGPYWGKWLLINFRNCISRARDLINEDDFLARGWNTPRKEKRSNASSF